MNNIKRRIIIKALEELTPEEKLKAVKLMARDMNFEMEAKFKIKLPQEEAVYEAVLTEEGMVSLSSKFLLDPLESLVMIYLGYYEVLEIKKPPQIIGYKVSIEPIYSK